MKKNEENFTLNFNTCLIVMKDIESVVKSATTTWKNIYNLHQLGDIFIHVSEKYDENDKKDDVNDDKEDVKIEDVNPDDKKEEQEAPRGSLPEIQSIKETDVENIVVAIMASFPHSSRKASL